MIKHLLMAALLLLMTTGIGWAQQNPRPVRPPGWVYRAAVGINPPAFAYDPCPGCYPEDVSPIVVSCPRGQAPVMLLMPPDANGAITRSWGRMIEVGIEIDGQRLAVRGKVDEAPTGSLMEVRLDPASPLFAALGNARMIRLVSPGGGGVTAMPGQGAGAVIRQWTQACGFAPAGAAGAGQGTSQSAGQGSPAAAGAGGAVAAFMASQFQGIRPGQYEVTMVDLNADGVREALVDVLPQSGYCGAAQCPSMILELSGPAPRVLFDGLTAQFRPRATRTQGWLDIGVFGGGVLRWRGNQYVLVR